MLKTPLARGLDYLLAIPAVPEALVGAPCLGVSVRHNRRRHCT